MFFLFSLLTFSLVLKNTFKICLGTEMEVPYSEEYWLSHFFLKIIHPLIVDLKCDNHCSSVVYLSLCLEFH